MAGREAAGERRRGPSRKNGESQPNSHTQRRPMQRLGASAHARASGQRRCAALKGRKDQIFAKGTGAGEVAVGSFERGEGGGRGLAAPARHGGSCTKVSRLRLLLLRLRLGPAAARPKAGGWGSWCAKGGAPQGARSALRLVGRGSGARGPAARQSVAMLRSMPAAQWREAM